MRLPDGRVCVCVCLSFRECNKTWWSFKDIKDMEASGVFGKNRIKRPFSLHAVMDETLQCEFDGSFESWWNNDTLQKIKRRSQRPFATFLLSLKTIISTFLSLQIAKLDFYFKERTKFLQDKLLLLLPRNGWLEFRKVSKLLGAMVISKSRWNEHESEWAARNFAIARRHLKSTHEAFQNWIKYEHHASSTEKKHQNSLICIG